MSYPPGVALVAEFDFFKNGALTDPSPLPTIILAYKGDGSTITPPVLTHTATGRFRATVFSPTDTASIQGRYTAIAMTTDATMDSRISIVSWDVVTILNQLSLISNGVVFTTAPVSANGATVLVRGASYKIADGRSLIYTLSGYPALNVGQPAYWRAPKAAGGVLQITGTCIATNQMQFELADTDTALLESGKYSLKTSLVSTDIIKTPNDTLRILESI